MADKEQVVRATFTPQTGDTRQVEVHFNPNSLQYEIRNSFSEQEDGGKRKQHVSQTTAKLTMELQFDTTHDGSDVRNHTDRIAKLLAPDEENGRAARVVEFSWGTFKLTGVIESYRETIDFFSPSGVPLRALVNISMAQQDRVFERQESAASGLGGGAVMVAAGGGMGIGAEIGFGAGIGFGASVSAGVGFSAGASFSAGSGIGIGGAAGIAAVAGDPRAARSIASANGEASLRFSGQPMLAVGGGASLGGPVGLSASAGFGVGVGAGASAGAGAGTSAGGAFAGLRQPQASAGVSLDARRLLPQPASARLGTDAGASFSLGGRAAPVAGGSLNADVGQRASLKGRLKFDN